MSPKKKKNSKKPSLEDIVNKLSSLAKSQQEEKGKGDATPINVTKPVKFSTKKTMPVTVKSKMPVRSKKKKSGQCVNCKRAICRSCIHCLDMPRFGENGKLKQAFKARKCLALVSTISESSLSSVSSMIHSSSSLLMLFLLAIQKSDLWLPPPLASTLPAQVRIARRADKKAALKSLVEDNFTIDLGLFLEAAIKFFNEF